MRTFYVFKIKKEMTILTKETPYNLYRTIENLYYLDNSYMSVSFKVYRYYKKDGNVHKINNKYIPEESMLKVYRSHIVLKSNVIKPTFLVNYLMSDNLFVCDFKNKDYFWLDQYCVLK